ncbi:hypothetical protein HW130_07910 [Streptomyces sp. PKU-EA00015]|uniref:hypothetical protein n=1 Tax=Streptomyces sp. PKU-EA00015 TaxID=2748326 RepID=UPI0015A00A41|nr:hypothetical protein [Streptomyces sp. PKU-EA00015]NWF26193.1 hypothetical protein [Streptomyces sp. PKU-EA00015]
MPDRRHRTNLLLTRERQSTDDDNPFAPPPEGRPDQPWRPRQPLNDGSSSDGRSSGSSGSSPDGSDGSGGTDGSNGSNGSNWGSQWSSRQPGRSSGGFGGRPGGQRGDQNGPEGGGPGPGGLRWDPTDPVQRRARYALLGGMWAFFFALFDFPEIALLLGALAVYWSVSSLRAKPRRTTPEAVTSGAPSAAPAPSPQSNRPQITAAMSGLVMAGIALLIVAASFTAQLVYRDYYTCVNDALTKSGQLACNDLLPEPLRDVLGVKE